MSCSWSVLVHVHRPVSACSCSWSVNLDCRSVELMFIVSQFLSMFLFIVCAGSCCLFMSIPAYVYVDWHILGVLYEGHVAPRVCSHQLPWANLYGTCVYAHVCVCTCVDAYVCVCTRVYTYVQHDVALSTGTLHTETAWSIGTRHTETAWSIGTRHTETVRRQPGVCSPSRILRLACAPPPPLPSSVSVPTAGGRKRRRWRQRRWRQLSGLR